MMANTEDSILDLRQLTVSLATSYGRIPHLVSIKKETEPVLRELKKHLVNHAPSLLRYPLKWTPFFIQQEIVQRLLSWQFTEALAEGDLDFLRDRWLKIEVSDLGLHWFISVQDDRLVVSGSGEADVIFSGAANDLILIAARKEDPDTLFFQRRLRIEGDTELGLYVKNLMDAIELEAMPSLLRAGLFRLADFIEEGLQYQPDNVYPDHVNRIHKHHPPQTDEIAPC